MKSKYVIFLVDDDTVFLEMLKQSINDNPDCKVFTFESREDCIKHMHLNPDVVVLDYYLNSKNSKAKNGLEVLKKISEINSETKVIILSGQEDCNLVYDCVRENATSYIVKDKETFQNVGLAISNIIDAI